VKIYQNAFPHFSLIVIDHRHRFGILTRFVSRRNALVWATDYFTMLCVALRCRTCLSFVDSGHFLTYCIVAVHVLFLV